MPYTPPNRSPGNSGLTSPLGSRQHSFTDMHNGTHSPPRSPRPNLPRSAHSAAYLQKTRRSAPYQTLSPPLDQDKTDASHHEETVVLINPSLRQSPPPVTDAAGMPAGAVLSPPDSTQNSSDDEEEGQSRPRQVLGLMELEDAVRSMEVVDEPSSPVGSVEDSNAPLTLKIRASNIDGPMKKNPQHTHSVSAQESSFFDRRGSISSVGTYGSEESDDDERYPRPNLVRKKSGELVKPSLVRPSSQRRHSSMPGTPTYKRGVHFDEHLEEVRHFLVADRPIAVSAGTSPADGRDDDQDYHFPDDKSPATSNAVSWEIRAVNFPPLHEHRRHMPIRADRLFLSADQKSLIGIVAVANLAFQKTVVARFTLDYWKTTSEVVAEYDPEQRLKPRDDGFDQFKFSIKLSDQANLETRTLLLCLRYDVNGTQYWDSNDGQNFQVDFMKKTKSAPEEEPKPMRALPHSKHNNAPALPRSRSTPAFDEDFAASMEERHSLRFKESRERLLPDTPPPTMRKHNSSGSNFGTRYDFGASLSTALSNAQAALGDKSGIKSKSNGLPPKPSVNPAFFTGSPVQGNGSGSPMPQNLQNKALDSRAYQEFVSKYCFFGSAPTSKDSSPKTNSGPPRGRSRTTDGAEDEELSPTTPPTQDQYGNHYPSGSGLLTFADGSGQRPIQREQQFMSPFLAVAPSSTVQSGYTTVNHTYPYNASPFGHKTPTAIHG